MGTSLMMRIKIQMNINLMYLNHVITLVKNVQENQQILKIKNVFHVKRIII